MSLNLMLKVKKTVLFSCFEVFDCICKFNYHFKSNFF